MPKAQCLTPSASLLIRVNGIVQGVGFRPFVYRLAHAIGISGHVRNRGDAGVEILASGTQTQVDTFLRYLRANAPPLSNIVKLECHPISERREPEPGFRILPSESGGEGSGTIPPDVAICDECQADLKNPTRYQGYWATSCTNCGARFTLVEELPYDRERTSMRDFPLCPGCEAEYTDPGDRRYHAQATACEHCGPRLEFIQGNPNSPSPVGSSPAIQNPKSKIQNRQSAIRNPKSAINSAVASLRAGRILAIKGIGGSHLACNAASEEAVARLRSRRKRFCQPFAIMAREDMLPSLAIPSPEELEELTSWRRPIVVLPLGKGARIAPSVNPGMASVGVMLPYTGLHHLLFEHIDFPLVMTSANVPGLPMAIENGAILGDLAEIADDFLLHDRRIVSRCDDSVVRFSGGGRRLIRRSRGWAPAPVDIDLGNEPILALGAELQNAIALYTDGKVYLSQFIGDVDKLETFDYLKASIAHLLALTGQKLPDTIVCDLHPDFLTTQLAEELVAEGPTRKIVRVQHHHAHIVSVMGEQGLDACIGIAVDGIGYGSDGRVWGGEVLFARRDGFEKVGGLASVPMPGGDMATRYPARMVASYLSAAGIQGGALRTALDDHLEFVKGKPERDVVLRQLETGTNSPDTSSAGRFFDAASSLLGLCDERTFEGEPAMRLEACATKGTPRPVELHYREWRSHAPHGSPITHTLDTPHLFLELFDMKEQGVAIPDIAATAQASLAEGLAAIAIAEAKERAIKDICLSGGVAYNDAIASRIRYEVESAGLRFRANEAVPCGDGGIAFGQCVVAAAEQLAKARFPTTPT